MTAGTTLISVSLNGPRSGARPSLSPVLSPDGRTLFFESWSPDIAAGDFNQSSDIFALTLASGSAGGGSTNGPPLAFSGVTPAATNAPVSATDPITLTWLAEPGAAYQVQFKNSLTDPQWQPLNSPATVVGNQEKQQWINLLIPRTVFIGSFLFDSFGAWMKLLMDVPQTLPAHIINLGGADAGMPQAVPG